MLCLCAGDLKRVEALCRRSRQSMKAILQLEAVPSMEMCEAEQEELRSFRETALAGEAKYVWAIQTPGDPSSRQSLPDWVAKPIQSAILRWGEDNRKWRDLIASRAEEGKSLTPLQKKNYEEWQSACKETKMLFDKNAQSCVLKLRANADLKAVQANMFSLRLCFHEDAENLMIHAGNGDGKQLVFLKSDPIAEDQCALPESFEGVEPGVAESMQKPVVHPAEDEFLDQDMEGHQEHEALLQQDMAIDQWEILADTSDEEVDKLELSVKPKKVKSFHFRPAYLKLEAKNLTMVPSHRQGVYLCFHSTSSTWQGFYPGVSHGLSYTFGSSTKRALAKGNCA